MPRDGFKIPAALGIKALNADQQQANAEIDESIRSRRHHLCTGAAGSGKTTLIQYMAAKLASRRGDKAVLTAPTHKAVSVLRRKLKKAGIDIQCRTTQSLLGLKAQSQGDKLIFVRDKYAEPVEADIVVIDEVSMVGQDLFPHINRHLAGRAVLFFGDSAQLNPVGESYSPAFDTVCKSHLSTIERQHAGNPILDAADCLREQQGGRADWSWVQKSMASPYGVYMPGDRLDAWMRKAFTSSEFADDADNFRFLTWTNSKVAAVNAKVRAWLYGENLPTPFSVGERILARSAVVKDETVIINNSEEVAVLMIERGDVDVTFKARGQSSAWDASIPTWHIVARNEDGAEVDLHMVRDDERYRRVTNRLKDEARGQPARWKDYHRLVQQMAVLQSAFAQTIHGAQGSTYRTAFLDVPEMRRWANVDLLEAQRGAYVGVTRPTHSLILAGT